MKELVILGPPGSGKTSLFRALLAAKKDLIGVDANLEYPPEGLEIVDQEPFKVPVPLRNYMICAGCALCQKSCPFGAIYEEDLWIDPLECEGCGLCVKNCPNQALQLANMQIGELCEAQGEGGKLLFARLLPGAKGAPRLVKGLREKAKKMGPFVLDTPPYYGEFLAYALEGAEGVLLILTPEEGASYLLGRVLNLAPRAKMLVLLNKFASEEDRKRLKKELSAKGLQAVGEIPLSSPEEFEASLKAWAPSFLELANL